MIAGVVLAAGHSSRLGRSKQLLPLQGEPLLRHTVRRVLASSLDDVLVVIGHEAEAIRETVADLPVGIVVNPDSALGQSTSVRAGLRALHPETEAVIFLLGDQPAVAPEVIDALIVAWQEMKASVVAPSYSDGVGHPVLFDRRVFPELATLRGDMGARRVVRAHERAGSLHRVPVAGPIPPDIDTASDYAALIASLPSPPRVTGQ